MRKLFLIAVLLITSLCSYGQFINLPDTNFRNALIPIYPTCFNAAKQLDTNCAKTQTRTTLTLGKKNVNNATGIQYFSFLNTLNLDSNSISIINNLPNNCTNLSISNAGISSLPNLSNLFGVRTLSINKNNLSTLTNLPPNLVTLNCSNNSISNYTNLPSSLLNLSCNYNNLTSFSFTGLSSLTSFNCSNNLITQLPALPLNLTTLVCADNLLLQLPNLPESLTYLDCQLNMITQLPSQLPNNLFFINCRNNRIINLPPLPKKIQQFAVERNQITNLPRLDTLSNMALLGISFNFISTIPNLPNSMRTLYADSCLLSQFPPFTDSLLKANRLTIEVRYNNISQIPNNMRLNVLRIDNNPINILPTNLNVTTSFSLANTAISNLPDSILIVNQLVIDNSNITQLSPNWLNNNKTIWFLSLRKTRFSTFSFLRNFSNLRYLYLDNTSISNLPQFNQPLEWLTLSNTPNLFCLPKLMPPTNLSTNIYLDSSRIKCLKDISPLHFFYNTERKIDSVNAGFGNYSYVHPTYIPIICNPTNNINNCQSNPAISSNIYYDLNNNNTKDTNEPFATNIGVRLTNLNRTTTNVNGAFTIYADTIGTQTVTITAPRFYSAVPNNINVNLTRYDTSVSLPNIALQLTTLKDSLSTKITPINWAARPGFVYPYLVHYKNVGSTTINATASLQYNNALLNYDSSSNSAVTNTGTQLNLALNSFMPGQEANYIAYFKVKPSGSLLGQVLNGYSNITGGTATAIDSTRITIGGSYDPNDKLSTPQLSTTQVAEGQFINYTIRFQNTGTDTAFTVVIADTLNSLLQANTFEMLGSSHACKTTIQDNKLYFEFRNILLPDSNVNLIGSNGFVNFRIKPQSSVVLNTVIPNKGAIYFDYNEPIITNTATTTISNTILPTHLLGFSAALQSNKTVLLYWNTSNEINTQFFVVEQSTNGKDFELLETVSAKGSGNNSYYINKVYNNLPTELYYRLKTIDKDGSISYSNIIKIKQANATGWSIVTNPAKGKLLIEVKDKSLQNTQARLVNGLGQVLQTITVQQGFNTLNLKNLKAGLYYVQTQNGTKQVVVE